MEQGEVWSVTLPFAGEGREQSGQRPAVVLQNSVHGEGSPLVVMVPLTSQMAALRFPATLRIEPSLENGLTRPSVAMGFQVRALDRSRFVSRLGKISAEEIKVLLSRLNLLLSQNDE